MGLLSIATNIVSSHNGPIVVVDENPVTRHNIVAFFVEHNMRVIAVSGRHELIRSLASREPELVILHADIARDGGFEIVRDVRSRSAVPLLLIGGEGQDDIDRIIGFELGADAYLSTPFSLRELLALVRSRLRRRELNRLSPARQGDRRYSFAGWLFDQRMHELRDPSGDIVSLTKSELNLLGAFVVAPRRTLTREYLLQATRLHEDAYDRSIDVQVLRLRRKLKDDEQAAKLICTRRGVGYVFDTDVQLLPSAAAM